MKSLNDLIENYDLLTFVNRQYHVTTEKLKENLIVDINETLKWNKQYVKENNEKYDAQVKEYNEAKRKKFRQYEEDLIKAFAEEESLELEEAKVIWEYAYQQSHSNGYREVVYTAYDIAEVVKKIKELK